MAITLGNCVICGLLNHVVSATITASEEATGYDADNLKIPSHSPSSRYRSTTVTANRNIDFDLGSVKSDIEAIVIHGVNFTDSATIRILVDSDSGFPSPEHDSGTINAFDLTYAPAAGLDDKPYWGRTIVYLPSTTWAGRYVRLTSNDTTNTDGYLQASYAIIGPAIQPGRSSEWSPNTDWLGEQEIPRKVHTITFKEVSEQKRRELLSITYALRKTGRFTVLPFTSTFGKKLWVTEGILCRLRSPIVEEALPGQTWNLTMQVEEVTD